MNFILIIPIILSIGPVSIIAIMNNNRNVKLWLSFILGMAGWYIALILRTPILIIINYLDATTRMFLSAVLAGLFEEPTRYFIIKYVIRGNKDPKAPISLGLGWGFSEALLVYVINVLIASVMYEYRWIDFLPGALERNTACLFHAAMAMLLGYSILKDKKNLPYIALAIILHGSINIIPFVIIHYINDVWIMETLLFIITLLIALPIIHVYRRKSNKIQLISINAS
ncbi:MAG: YhfC family intramembrane metalloprotease [Staphylothermus sp.]|nr:YhfC family intramembrane metalloprotease [Staphylothermus sp.]